MKGKRLKLLLYLVLGLVVGAAAGLVLRFKVIDRGAPGRVAETLAPALGGPFSLVDQHGKNVTDADFRGRFMLIYFGYTYCPDVCPTELQDMGLALDALGAAGDSVQPVFVTIDPERDTVAALAHYADLFHPRLVALTGTSEQVAAVAKAYGVYYARSEAEPGASEGEYLMDHSTFIYLMGPDGGYLARFPHGTSTDALAEGILNFL